MTRLDWILVILCALSLAVYFQVPGDAFWVPFVYRNY